MRAFVVAVGEIAGPLDEVAADMAAACGLAVYDVKNRLAGPLPRVLFQSQTEEPARRALSALRARGHVAFLCDTGAVPRGRDIVRVRRFVVTDTGLASEGPPRAELAFDRIGAIARFAMRSSVIRSTREKELVPNGARPPATIEVEHEAHESLVVHAAYVWPRLTGLSDQKPWLFHEREMSFLALGADMRPTRRENLGAAIDLLRQRAPTAIYDERFLAHPLVAAQVVTVRDNLSPDPPGIDAAVAVSAHLLGAWLLGGAPYR